ncbi:hypothetical protein [Methylobacterium nodulans]|uniref:Uncharacterized protein n=1 Tax=Methylobacterium nodulans (strain LMG 21967 / CNCM I-2342 / ORS 2060) TaxID=460265 RepID=B8IF80_METNO|nr:hypothetical protein [Methylobacterium nodulans]ACL55791.1 conserved hypothetical protein [Methylobacterium nodulans ORS 2060]
MRLITVTLPIIVALAGPALAQSTAPVQSTAPAGRTTPTQNPFAQGSGTATKPAPTTAPAPSPAQKPAATAPAGAVFPTAIAPKYEKEPPGKARQQTCLDQYHANKAAGGAGNGGLNWIQKNGGYWSECNKRLKG